MPVDKVFRRKRSSTHTSARTSRHHPKIEPALVRAIMLAIGLGLATAVVILARPTVMLPKISQIVCQLPDTSACPSSVTDQLQSLNGQSLLFTPLAQHLDQELALKGYRAVSYTRALPTTLYLTVEPLDVICYLEYDGTLVGITASGVAIPQPTQSDASLLRIRSRDPVTNQQIVQEAQVPHWLIQTIKDLSAFFQTRTDEPLDLELVTPFELRLSLATQSAPILINPQESALNLARVSTILKSNQEPLTASASATLDVRFRLPVLRR